MSKGIRSVAFTRDRHPPNHGSFREQGGAWPVHCVDGTHGCAFHNEIPIPADALIVDKGMKVDEDNFDGFHATKLGESLRRQGVRRVFVLGLATDYCVKATAFGSIREGFETWVVVDGIAGVEADPGDCDRALVEMRLAGAELIESGAAATLVVHQPHPSGLVVVDMQNDFFAGGALPVPGAERVFGPVRKLLQLHPQPR